MDEQHALDMLEKWRIREGLTKTALAKLLGLKNSQNYTNWLGRGSIPKEFWGVARVIPRSSSLEDAEKRIKSEQFMGVSQAREIRTERYHLRANGDESMERESLSGEFLEAIDGLNVLELRTLLGLVIEQLTLEDRVWLIAEIARTMKIDMDPRRDVTAHRSG